MYGTGLTLGKFAPFHRGHGHLLTTAIKECRKVVVIVYGAKRTTDIPLGIRAGWIRALHPEAEVLEAPGAPEDTGQDPGIQRLQEDFIRSFLAEKLPGQSIDAFYSSEDYGGHVSRSLGCENRIVDMARSAFPVSATMVRDDPVGTRDFVYPLIRADLVRRIVLLGGPSTGKTSLAKALGESLGEPWCPEYGREYWFAHQVDHRLSMADLEIIAARQAALEAEMAREASLYLPVDTSPLTTLVYARYYHARTSPALEATLSSYLGLPRSYWLCEPDFPFEDSADRSGPPSRAALQALTIEELDRRGISWKPVSGNLGIRTTCIIDDLKTKENKR